MPTKVLSVDGRTLHDAPRATSREMSPPDELASFQTRLDAVLPAARPREPLGKLAATRAAERAKAMARVESHTSLAQMRQHGAMLRSLALKHQAAVAEARSDRFLSDVGK